MAPHCASAKHKENLEQLKVKAQNKKDSQQMPPPGLSKGKPSTTTSTEEESKELPGDFFDEGSTNTTGSAGKTKVPQREEKSAIPEGFFDNKEMDQKKRNADPKDLVDMGEELKKISRRNINRLRASGFIEGK